MDIVQDLRERRGLFQLVTQMMVKVGKACQEKDMEAAARQSYAAAYVVMEQMDQIDQALAVLDEGVMKPVEVEMVCSRCGEVQNLRAVINVLVPADSQGWDEVKCQSCEGHVGHIRRDTEKVPKAYSLTIHGVLDYELDVRTNDERKPEADALGRGTEAKAEELPPAQELRAILLGETMGSPVAVQHGNGPESKEVSRAGIKDKLAAAKAKIGAGSSPIAVEASEEDDF